MSELQEKRIRSLQAQVLDLKADMERLARDAWLAGFHSSGEGWNGEWPFESRNGVSESDLGELNGYCDKYIARLKIEGKL